MRVLGDAITLAEMQDAVTQGDDVWWFDPNEDDQTLLVGSWEFVDEYIRDYFEDAPHPYQLGWSLTHLSTEEAQSILADMKEAEETENPDKNRPQ